MDQSTFDLYNEVSNALAELATSASESHADMAEISSTLAEMLELMKARKEPEPQCNVTVQPAPVNVQVLPAATYHFHITHEYDKGGRLITSHVKRIQGA